MGLAVSVYPLPSEAFSNRAVGRVLNSISLGDLCALCGEWLSGVSIHHRDTEDTKVAQRRPQLRRYGAVLPLCGLVSVVSELQKRQKVLRRGCELLFPLPFYFTNCEEI